MDELNSANKIMVRMLQDQHFNREKVSLQNGVFVFILFKTLSAFSLDKDNVIRVGGRLKCSIVYNHKHPIILPNQRLI